MEAGNKPKVSSSSIVFLLLIGTTAVGLFFLIQWLISIEGGEKPIEGINLVFALLTLVTTIGFGLQTIRIGQVQSDAATKIQNVEASASKKIQESNEELFYQRLQLVKAALSELTDEQLLTILPPELRDRTDFFILRAREYEEYADICHEVADHLERQKDQLRKLAKEASDLAIARLNPSNLKRSKLRTRDSQVRFFGDVYAYLRLWLKYSIDYDFPMPRLELAFPDEKIVYVDTFKFLRDERLDWFSLPSEKHKALLKKYLNILISNLEGGR